jgi:outer membrane protein assembly factor BamB
MSSHHNTMIVTAIVASLALLMCSSPANAEDSPTPAKSDWPMFIGNGNRTPPKQGIALIDDLDAIRKVWELDRHMGVAKGLYPGTLRKSRQMGIEPFYGGAASPIVADGTVFCTYYKPDGRVPATVEPWRTVSDPKALLPSWFFSISANDILIAVDAGTGRMKWEAVEKGRGMNRLGHKRAHWCVSPAYADGRVFSMGSAGLLYAYDAQTGNKLWETQTSAALEALKKEHTENRKLCWKAKQGSSLVIADGVVVVSQRSLLGIGTKTGKVRWRIEGNIESRHGTPALWHHKDRRYLLANSETGDLRLIDPEDGRVIWHVEGLGPSLGTLSPTGDIVIVNTGSKHGDGKSKYGLYGALRLSLKGTEKLWTLPDTQRYRHWWKMDSGAFKTVAIQDGRAYIIIRRPKKTADDASPRALLIVVDAATGKILSEQDPGNAHSPYVMEDRMLIFHDRAHSDPVTASFWTADIKLRQLTSEAAFRHIAITAYEVPIQWPFVDGLLYCRTLKGLLCYDLRKPTMADNARIVQLSIPGALAGRRTDLQVMLYEHDGHLTHGGFREGKFLHDVDISGVRWNGKRLKGVLDIDVEGNRKSEAYDVDAMITDDTIGGTVKTAVTGFDKPIPVSGSVSVVEHQPTWMPDCTYVLRLNEAVCNANRTRQYLLLFVTVADGRLIRVEGFAPRTTKSRPVIDTRHLKLIDGRLTGKVVVRFRPDPWSAPLAERGDSAAAEYSLNCKLVKTGEAGSYKGSYGVEWSQTGRLEGKIEAIAVAAQSVGTP